MKKKYLLPPIILLILICFTAKAQNHADHSILDQILILNVTPEGKVNYDGVIRDRSLFYTYFKSLSDNPPTDRWSRDETLAYWINAYNAIALKMVIDNYPIKSINDIENPWKRKFLTIKDKQYSLDDIEHSIIRRFNEPRIHFVINCAANSSPKLMNMAYTSDNIKYALERSAVDFINDPTKNIITENEVVLSQVFDWYKDDFNKGNVIDFINQYSKVKISSITAYKKYDWALNKQ